MSQPPRALDDEELQRFADQLDRFRETLTAYDEQLFVALVLASAGERPDVRGYWHHARGLLESLAPCRTGLAVAG
jgi:hypothetical protein